MKAAVLELKAGAAKEVLSAEAPRRSDEAIVLKEVWVEELVLEEEVADGARTGEAGKLSNMRSGNGRAREWTGRRWLVLASRGVHHRAAYGVLRVNSNNKLMVG